MVKNNLKQEALVLIGQYFGDYTKELYVTFYKDKPLDFILKSLHELLLEVLGPQKSKDVLVPLGERYNITLDIDEN